MLSFIWAEAKNHVIGNHGKIPWNEPADMHHFVKLTSHHIIISGLTTFKSYGRPSGLPNRTNILLSKSVKKAPQGVILFHDVPHLLKYVKAHSAENIFVCGGRSVYKELAPYVYYLYRTIINHNFDGDTKFESPDYHKFQLLYEDDYPATKRNPYPYIFQTWRRKKRYIKKF